MFRGGGCATPPIRGDISRSPLQRPILFWAPATTQPGRPPRSPPSPRTRHRDDLSGRWPCPLDSPPPEMSKKRQSSTIKLFFCLPRNEIFLYAYKSVTFLCNPDVSVFLSGPGSVLGWEGLTPVKRSWHRFSGRHLPATYHTLLAENQPPNLTFLLRSGLCFYSESLHSCARLCCRLVQSLDFICREMSGPENNRDDILILPAFYL